MVKGWFCGQAHDKVGKCIRRRGNGRARGTTDWRTAGRFFGTASANTRTCLFMLERQQQCACWSWTEHSRVPPDGGEGGSTTVKQNDMLLVKVEVVIAGLINYCWVASYRVLLNKRFGEWFTTPVIYRCPR